ncbi:MAG: glycosyltransferase family 2 protein [Bacteroidales bacterium]|nr:glycosyltransferase family 2 protein [Bacteroidales bacterium]
MEQSTIAVIILNYNGATMLRQFLPSVIAHSDDAEIVVADNASTDDSLEVLRTQFPEVRVTRFSENHGFAEGYNRAIARESADHVVLLNSDVEVTAGWLRPLRAYLDTYPDCVAAQPKLRAYHQRTHFEYAGAAGGYLDYLGYPFCRGRVMAEVEADYGQYDTPADVLWATGAALYIRREAYEEAGGLDARFFAHQEEIDLCWRLRSRGYRIVCLPESVVYHVGGGTLDATSPRKTLLNFRNNLLMLYKNLPDRQLRSVLRCRRWLDALAWLKFVITGQWQHAAAVREARKRFHEMVIHYEDVRAENISKTTTSVLPEIMARSLLWQHVIGRVKTFDKLSFY